MGVVLAARAPGLEECAKWDAVAPTSPPEGLPTGLYDVYEAEVFRQHGEDADSAFERIRARLFAYDIFPPNLIRFVICPGPAVEHGTLIVQRAGIGPLRLESAVRVVEVWDRDAGGRREAGFRYVTLAGHSERGVASFAVRRDESGVVRVKLDARSQPGTLLGRLGRPIARPGQLAMTKAALKRLAGKSA